MKHKKILLLLFYGILPTYILFAQNVTGGKVNEKFIFENFKDDFTSDNSNWPIVANADNLFIIQDGHYILHRKNTTNRYFLFSKWPNNLDAFHIKTAIKLDPAYRNKEASVGIFFMMQEKGKGAFIIEINSNKQYRISQYVYNTLHFLSGEEKDAGWVKSSIISNKDDFNVIEVKTANKQYDVFINNTYITSFTEITYKFGDMGIIVGADTKAELDYFYVFSNQETEAKIKTDTTSVSHNSADTATNTLNTSDVATETIIDEENNNNETNVNDNATPPDADLIQLTEAIVKLRTKVNELSEENEKFKEQIKNSKDLLKTLKSQESQLMKINVIKDSLQIECNKLKKYKELVDNNENKDLIILLSKSLQNEKIKADSKEKENEYFRNEIKALKDSLKIMNENLRSAIRTLEQFNIIQTDSLNIKDDYSNPTDTINNPKLYLNIEDKNKRQAFKNESNSD